MKRKWAGAVLVFGAATGLIIWRELWHSPAASPAPAGARVVLYADLGEVDETEGCGAIIRGVREAARLGGATEEIDARKPSDRLARYKLLVAPSVLFLDEAGREVKRYEGEAPDTVRALLEQIRNLRST
jgi:hypothetical protein